MCVQRVCHHHVMCRVRAACAPSSRDVVCVQRVRHHHAVELPADDARLEDGRLHRRRQHRRAQAGAGHAADVTQVWRAGGARWIPAWRHQHHLRIRCDSAVRCCLCVAYRRQGVVKTCCQWSSARGSQAAAPPALFGYWRHSNDGAREGDQSVSIDWS